MMNRLLILFMALSFAQFSFATDDVQLPGPGAPPTQPPPPQPTPPPRAEQPPPGDDYPAPPPQQPPREAPGNDVTYTLGSGSVGRFKDRSFTFRARYDMNKFRAMRMQCTDAQLRILKVIVRYTDGRTERIPNLEITYRAGQSHIAYMDRRPVSDVTVIAESTSMFKKGGAFRLDAAAARGY